MRNGGMRNGKSKNARIKIKSQNFRLFLAYTGRKYDYSKASGLTDYNTDRIEIGMLYRLKAY
ncbi:hypothetical protein DW917_03205 [Prevotella sp. AM42-24]|jgi:adenosyl cobinamide kinase/adenosyl cobinamide phosphate guanylyltransferase|nr:hypothetical protein DW917_03205 [Prevotella sp. AM42-24]